MIFRLADISEKDIILSMYDENRGKEYCAWDDTYPTMDNILKDINTNNLFVLEDNDTIVGSIAINYENEIVDEPLFNTQYALEFGRVIVKKEYRRKGYGKILIQNIEKEIKNRGYNNIHILVFVGSIVANNMYKNLGYKMCDVKNFSDIDFVLYEKNI